jgi:hypothetical protein
MAVQIVESNEDVFAEEDNFDFDFTEDADEDEDSVPDFF